MDIPLPGEIIPFPSSPSRISKSPPPMPPLPPDFDHIPLPPSVGKQFQSPSNLNHLSKVPPLPPTAPPLPPTTGKNFTSFPPLPISPKGVPSVESKGNGEAILWSAIPPPPAPAPPEDSRYSPSHATPADEESERVLLPASFTLPPPPPPSDHTHLPASMHSSPKLPTNPPLPPTRPPLFINQPDPPSLPTPPPKTAVLGKMQAKKRLLAFSMTKQGGGLGLSFGFAKSTRVVNKASANAFVGGGEDEETIEKKEVMNKSRKKKKEEREVLAIEEIKREEERLKEALGIRQQAQRAEQWAEEMWGISPPVHEMMIQPSLGAPVATSGEERDAVTSAETSAIAAVDSSVPTSNLEGGGVDMDSHHNNELETTVVGDMAAVITEPSASLEHGDGAKGKGEGVEGKEDRKEGSERRDKKGERSSRKKESGERNRRREEEGGEKERSKRGSGGRSGRGERRSERKKESRRSSDGPPSGWKQLKESGGEWNRERSERTSHRSGVHEERGRERRGSHSHRSRSRDHKRSAHSAHRSRSRSTDVHRRPQVSPFFVAKGAKHGEKEFPLRLLRHTRTRPPLSYCENPETAAPPRPTTRREAFASEPPDVVRIMRLVAEAGLEKEMEGKEHAGEASGLAALRVSYEGGDEDEGEDEQKRSDRPWFPEVSAFLSESAALARVSRENAAAVEDGSPARNNEVESKSDYEMIPEDTDITGSKEIVNEMQEKLNAKADEEDNNKETRKLQEESESMVHSRWDSDPDSGGMAALDKVEKNSLSPEAKAIEQDDSIKDETDKEEDQNEADEFAELEDESDTDENEESENTEEDTEGEEKKDQQLASEYEEFMKAVSVGGEDDEEEDDDDDGWGSGKDAEEMESCEVSDHLDSESSEHNSIIQNNAVCANSSDLELGSDVPSSEEAGVRHKVTKHTSSDSENNLSNVVKERLGNEGNKFSITKEKNVKKKERGKRDDSDSGDESESEMQVPRKKRKLSGKKTSVGEVTKRKGTEEKKRKAKVKEKSQKKKKEKRRKKKKERRKRRGHRRDDSSEVDSESEDMSDDARATVGSKTGRAKLSESSSRKHSHRNEPSSDELTSENSSESSDGEERRRLKKKKRKKRKKHGKVDTRREEDDGGSDEDDQGKKIKLHSGKKRRGRDGKNKRGSDNSDYSEERDEQYSVGDEKSKISAVGDSSMTGKENGIEDGSGKRGKKQKVKERGRKKKRKGSPLSTKKHGSSRRRSPSTSDGSPTPGRGSHNRESVNKVQGSRGGASEVGHSSIDSNSSGGNKKPGDNTTEVGQSRESLHHWENTRVEGNRCLEESRTINRERTRELGDNLSKSLSVPILIGKSSGTSIYKDKELGCSALLVKKNIHDAVTKRILAECALNMSSSSSSSSSPASSLSLSSISSSSSTDSSCSITSQSDSASSSTSSSSSSSASSSVSSASSSSSESSSSVSSFLCSPSSPKPVTTLANELESQIIGKGDKTSPEILKGSSKSILPSESNDSYLGDISFGSSSKEVFQPQTECSDYTSNISDSNKSQNGAKCKLSLKETNEDSLLVGKSEYSLDDSSFARVAASTDISLHSVKMQCESSKSREAVETPDMFPCSQTVANEKFMFGLASQTHQGEDLNIVKSASKPKIGFKESKPSTVDPEHSVFKAGSEGEQLDGKSVKASGLRTTPLTSRPSRWDTRPVMSRTHLTSVVGSSGVRGANQEWETPLPVPGVPVLPVPFPTCRNKPMEEIPLPTQGVPQPVASPWGMEGIPNQSAIPVISSSELTINPICGLADSTISDSDLVGRCVVGGLGQQQQVGLTSSPALIVALERPLLTDNRPISSEGEQMVELFPAESDHFMQTIGESGNMYHESVQQHSADDKLMDHVVGGFSVVEHCIGKNAESSTSSFTALSGEIEHAVTPGSDPVPTDWDDPEAFVGSGHSGIKSHVIQVGNFLQVVPSEQPIISHPFTNPTPPVPAAVPMAAVSSGVAPVPVSPASAMSTVLPVAAPITSASVTFPTPVAPVSSSFQTIPTSSTSNLSSVSSVPCTIAPSLTIAPTPPSVVMVSTTSPCNVPTSIPSVASLIPALPTPISSLPSPTQSLSQIPILASLAPTSSCPGISQLPLDPAAFLGTLISHALALEKQQQQQQNLIHSPVCSPLVGGQSDDVPKESPICIERESRKSEKRKKVPKGNYSVPQQTAEAFPLEDDMPSSDPLTKAIQEDYNIDPEEVALIQEAMSKVPGEEEDFEEQSTKVGRMKEKRKKIRAGNTVLPPATRGILIPPGIREKPSIHSGGVARGLNSGSQGQRKSVMFADGVRPGDGTSPSAGEDLPSPPPPVRKVPKEKRLRKKKKIKVKIIRQVRVEAEEEDDDEDDDASPPPPPPGSPPPSLLLHHLSSSQHSPRGCEGAIPNPASHYPYPSAPTAPPTHTFSQLQAQQQLPPTPNAAHVPAGGSAALPPNALPSRIPQWAPCT